jgi:hypothetical protein
VLLCKNRVTKGKIMTDNEKEKMKNLERLLHKARIDVFSENEVVAEQAQKDIKSLKKQLEPFYEKQYNKWMKKIDEKMLFQTE